MARLGTLRLGIPASLEGEGNAPEAMSDAASFCDEFDTGSEVGGDWLRSTGSVLPVASGKVGGATATGNAFRLLGTGATWQQIDAELVTPASRVQWTLWLAMTDAPDTLSQYVRLDIDGPDAGDYHLRIRDSDALDDTVDVADISGGVMLNVSVDAITVKIDGIVVYEGTTTVALSPGGWLGFGLEGSEVERVCLFSGAEGCTEGGHVGDIYHTGGGDKWVFRCSQEATPTTYVNSGNTFQYDLAELKELIPVIVGGEEPNNIPITIKLLGGDIYLGGELRLPSHGATFHPVLLKITGSIPHTTTLLYDWLTGIYTDGYPGDFTFDSSGNIYAISTRETPVAYPSAVTGIFLYKFNPAGALQWRRELDPGVGDGFGGCWLVNDDQTLLYLAPVDADDFYRIKRYDIVNDVQLSDWFKITSPYDNLFGPPDPLQPYYYQNTDGNQLLLLPNGKLVVVVASNHYGIGTASNGPQESGIGYRGADRYVYRSLQIANESFVASVSNPGLPAALHAYGYQDEGWGIDSDPDDTSLWISSLVDVYLNRFNIATGERTKRFAVPDDPSDLGHANSAVKFAICGGAGGYGNPPPVLTPQRIAWVGAYT